MTISRRVFLEAGALAAAAGLPATLRAEWRDPFARENPSARPFLDLARRAAEWIDRSTQEGAVGLQWPADPHKPDGVGLDFYNGTPGVVAFFAAMHHAGGEPRWLERARGGADFLIHSMTQRPDALDAGLYTGLAGIGYALQVVGAAGGGDRYHAAAANALRAVQRRQATAGATAGSWSESHDIISGAAGTGLGLLAAGRRSADRAFVEGARRAGRRLVAAGEPAGGGLMWFPATNFRRNYPNFSHGTAGVAYFLATLHRATGEPAFLTAALAGARYLESVATRADAATRIFRQSEGGENRFYLSWCHGPVGTARLFYQLHQITGERRWLEWVDSLTLGVVTSGAPEERSAGYWNNISQCCGNIGIGQFCVDLARYHPTAAAAALRKRVVDDTMARSVDDAGGLRWIQAENRTEPENVVAQTGFMQGTAGVGMFLLQADAFDRGNGWPFPQPDTPFA